MLKQLPLRIAAPTMLVSFLLLALSIVVAVYLYHRQTSSEEALGENINSVQAAHDLENTLTDVLVLLRKGEQPDSLHQRMRDQLQEARDLADKTVERELVSDLDRVLTKYFALWEGAASSDNKPATFREG